MLSLEVAAGNRSEVVFVDTRVEGYETIVAGVARGAEVVLIDANGIAVGGISLGATTIRDGAGNNANLALSGHMP